MKLPELSAQAAPEFTDAASCKAWLEDVPLANVAAAQQDLLLQLEEFNRFPTGAGNRLAVLEALREAVSFVQIEQAKRFTNRALPMIEAESETFEETIGLWEQMRLGYLRCLDAALGGDVAMRAQGAAICQRLLAYCGLKMFHHYRAYRQVPARDWAALNEGYAHATQLNLGEEPVKDFLNRDVQDTSPRIAYARAVLMGMCSPNELAPRQLTFVAYLLERWAGKLEIADAPVEEGEGVPPLVADLASERCPERLAEGDPEPAKPLYLDARKLAKSLRNRVGLLRKGESPAKLALGEDCVQPSCEQLLVFLYRQWCQAKSARTQDRKPSDATAQASTDMNAIHRYISGSGFRQPVQQQTELTQKQREEIATFGRVSTRERDENGNPQGFAIENWHVEEESAQGLRLLRPAASPGQRLAHGQLMAVRPADAKSFILGQVRWLMGAENGDLCAGVKLLPGMPAAIAARPTGLNAHNVKFVPALSLGAVPALNSPPSLVLPSGWFKPKRVIEVFTDAAARVRLVEVLDRGTDFERVAYEPAP
jgi:hypothetical protein